MVAERLPLHGFVLVGGQSSRMGQDKAMLVFRGQPMAEIAIDKLKEVCEVVSVVGNRDDLAAFAPVAHEQRTGCGPAAGVEAGVSTALQEWALFIPVDAPFVPAELLHTWAQQALVMAQDGVSVLFAEAMQPAFCMVRRNHAPKLQSLLESGERRLMRVLDQLGEVYVYRVEDARAAEWFRNLNTPEELAAAEAASY
ncbi:molybdenum cofactor guanylyltransferase [Granulicella cerasi]|uniref:Probable molybdenum cofactor guanylyltransferase n=1 Tax=Granulicella cerasi TaxID=741063 RepID=A0ABW1ZD42_9BACT|nr:molybdenum cofactor guanylyltransferase [Granulicella cerasi]